MRTTESATDIVTLPEIQAVWGETLGDPEICIAVLDGPADLAHPSLATADLIQLKTLTSNGTLQGPASQHGTHVTSVIFGQHDSPIKGIAPHCRGLIVPIFTENVDGSIAPCSQLDLARAITQAVEAGAHVINVSGGELSPSGTAHPLLADAIQHCAEKGILIVSAVGNEGCECLHIPGALPSVLAVGAMNASGVPLDFSNWGEMYRVQGILAPGENILGALPGGGTIAQSGTSYATPIVSGVAGLLLSVQCKQGQEPNPQTVRTALLESAYTCDPHAALNCRPFLVGSLNIAGAYTLVTKIYGKGRADHRPGNSQVNEPVSTGHDPPGGQTMLKPGDIAPNFSARDHTNCIVRLSDYRGKTVVLWFYPQADTPG